MDTKSRKEATEAFRLYARHKAAGTVAEPVGSDEWFAVHAVSATLSCFRATEKPHIAEAVEQIYFADPFEPLYKGEIDRRVVKYCVAHYVCQRSVYNWLKSARLLYWAIRYP